MYDEPFHGEKFFWDPFTYSYSASTSNSISPNKYKSEYIIRMDASIKLNGEIERPKVPERRIAELSIDENILYEKMIKQLNMIVEKKEEKVIEEPKDKTELMFNPENLIV